MGSARYVGISDIDIVYQGVFMSASDGLNALLAVVVVVIIYLIMAVLMLGFVYLAVRVAKYAWFGAW